MTTPDTEVLRIRFEGNASVEDVDKFKWQLEHLLMTETKGAVFNVVKQDESTGMALYKVEEVNGYKAAIETWKSVYDKVNKESDAAFLKLTEGLAQERESKEMLNSVFKTIQIQNKIADKAIKELLDERKGLRKKIEILETTAWKRFIKWCKGLIAKLKRK
jgi:predicted acetyltransferase